MNQKEKNAFIILYKKFQSQYVETLSDCEYRKDSLLCGACPNKEECDILNEVINEMIKSINF